MDYVEAFENLKPNEKYGRKTPHKAVLWGCNLNCVKACS